MSTIYTRSKYNAPPLGVNMARQASPLEAFLHHSTDPDGLTYNTKSEQVAKIDAIDTFHRRDRGWAMTGYHWIVFQRTGTRNAARGFAVRPALYVPAAQANHNTRTLAICVIGDGEREQIFNDTIHCVARIIRMYSNIRTVGGHRDVVGTTCPGKNFYRALPAIAHEAGVKVR